MTVPIAARDEDGPVELRVVARLADGSISEASVGSVEFTRPAPPPSYDLSHRDGAAALIAICMATYEPNADLFRAQVESIRAQTDRDWICLVSDDCSRPERLAEIEEVLAGDPRFVLLPSDRRRGFYRNFERLLGLVPAEAELIALCDHDDRWYPDKLETLRAAVGGAQLAFSDQRLVDVDGRVLSESFWRGRRNNHTDLTSMMVANTITGSASLFRRAMLDVALPFPDIPGWQFHDHWLALAALATGRIAYVDRPLYDYVQHIDAVLGKLVLGHGSADEPGPPKRSLRGLMSGWRADHFCGYLQTEVQAQMLLARCGRELTPPKRRALKRMVASARSPFGLARLWVRPLRRFYGRNETLGGESQLVRGILWRHIVKLRSLRRERPGRSAPDASAPPCGAYSPDLKRLRRWRTPARLAQS
jgi:glycosyltransferase involved in cell wall biosynthesis